MNGIIVTTPVELHEIVGNAIKNALSDIRLLEKDDPRIEEEELLSFNQALLLLKISRPTLFKRMKDKTITYQRVGRRLLFPKRKILLDLEKQSINREKNYNFNLMDFRGHSKKSQRSVEND